MKRAEVDRYWEANAETWTRHARAGYDIYRDGRNTPAFLDMLPPVHGLWGLDIGCGEGSNSREFARGQDAGDRSRADLHPTRTHPTRTSRGECRTARRRLSRRGCDGFTLRLRLIRFCDGVHVDDGHGRPWPCLVRGSTGLRPGRFLQFSILHPCFVRHIAASFEIRTAQRGQSRSPAILMRPMGGSIPFGLEPCLKRNATKRSHSAFPGLFTGRWAGGSTSSSRPRWSSNTSVNRAPAWNWPRQNRH
jgi:hypothetical protein